MNYRRLHALPLTSKHRLPFASVTFEGSPLRLGYVCLSHPLALDASHLGFSSDQTTVQRPPGTSQRVRAHCSHGSGLQVPIQGVVQHLPVHWVGRKAVLEWQQLWGFLVGTEQVKTAGKGMRLPSPLLASPTGWAGRLLSINLLAYNCLFSLKTAPLVSCPNHDVAHLHLLVYLCSQNL